MKYNLFQIKKKIIFRRFSKVEGNINIASLKIKFPGTCSNFLQHIVRLNSNGLTLRFVYFLGVLN